MSINLFLVFLQFAKTRHHGNCCCQRCWEKLVVTPYVSCHQMFHPRNRFWAKWCPKSMNRLTIPGKGTSTKEYKRDNCGLGRTSGEFTLHRLCPKEGCWLSIKFSVCTILWFQRFSLHYCTRLQITDASFCDLLNSRKCVTFHTI